jgi:hypothetical protein
MQNYDGDPHVWQVFGFTLLKLSTGDVVGKPSQSHISTAAVLQFTSIFRVMPRKPELT